ncbi:MAG: DNA-formamidopyrimidine glycosylase family protein [Methanomicrobiales archaeon]
MPELPSVEVFKQYFDSNSLNQIIKSVNLKSKEILMEKPIRFQEILVGSQFTSSQRYGKYLFANLDNEYILVMHFGMTGSLEYGLNPLKNPYDRFSINFQNNKVLAFIDPRKFGKIGITDSMKNFIKKKEIRT